MCRPIHLCVTGCVTMGIALGVASGTNATITQNEKCNTTPVMPYQGNCSCESQGSYFACAQSIGMTHIHYQCGPSMGDECSSPTTSCGKKYSCFPYLCSDPNRTCTEQNHNCKDGTGDLMYKCVTL